MSLTQHCPAKINLFLNILGKRPDGFHELETVLHPIPLFDTLTLNLSDPPGIHLSCDHPDLPLGPENLIHRAAHLYYQTISLPPQIHIHLQKTIPWGAGLAGGSSNAAHTLLALNLLHQNLLSPEQLAQLASQLGSDIPFFLQNHAAIGRGRGEQIEPLPPLPNLSTKALVLIYPNFGISTPWAYQQLRHFPQALQGNPERLQHFLTNLKSPAPIPPDCYNTLELPAFRKYPLLPILQEYLLNRGAWAAHMSGSGSTIYGIFHTLEEAEKIAQQLNPYFGAQFWVRALPLQVLPNGE